MHDSSGLSPAILARVLAAPTIRPAAVARGRARAVSPERCPADAVAAALIATLTRLVAG